MSRFPRSLKSVTFLALFVAPLCADGVGYRDEALKRLAILERKVVGLAEAMPADKFNWRPTEGTRTVAEVNLHVAGVNFVLTPRFGTPSPDGFSYGGYEKSATTQAEVVAKLKASFAHIRKAIESLTAADSEKPSEYAGEKTTYLGTTWRALEHTSEHLGQLITYARLNGVVPPWS